MSRKSFLFAATIALALTGGTCATLILLIRHEPEAYRRAFVPPGPERTRHSKEFCEGLSQLFNYKSEPELDIRMTDEQINSYFAEGFKKSNLEKSLPDKISEPRVLLEPGKVQLAFRYGRGLWSTIVSMDFGVWLVEKEPNVVGLEVQGLHAGSLPVGTQFFLDSLTELAEQNGIQVQWYRYRGNPTALLRFQSAQQEMKMQLQTLTIDKGRIILRGRPVESGTARAAALPVSKPSTGN
jgi:hypothetical protein